MDTASRHRTRTLRADSRGAVYVEFLLSFVPLFVMVLGIAQHALMLSAQLVVQHAALRAARSAIVVLDDDPAHYGGEPRLSVDPQSEDGAWPLTDPVGGVLDDEPRAGGSRMRPIRMSAYGPLLALAPTGRQLMTRAQQQSLVRAVSGSGPSRMATAAVYNMGASAVTFPTAPGASHYRTDFRNAESVTVRVTYLYHCAIPIASRLMCDSMFELRSGIPLRALDDARRRWDEGSLTLSDIRHARSQIRTQRNRLGGSKRGLRELATAEQAGIQGLLLFSGARFRVLHAEATLPIHTAPYLYRSEKPDDGGES